MATNRRIVLAGRPAGLPSETDFRLVEEEPPTPQHGEVVVRNHYLSVDPYMRGRMRDRKSYAPPLEIGDVMVGHGVGRVVATASDRFAEGDYATGMLGWQEYAAVPADELRAVDPDRAPLSTAIGVLGMPGLTAYFGMLDVCDAKAGETVFVSGAAGAVGAAAGQIAKIQGCRVFGSAGTDEKVAVLKDELGFDGAFNYKTVDDYGGALDNLAPDGFDCYFDNVGGPLTDAVIPRLRQRGRVAVCGQISQYNLESGSTGPRWLFHLIINRARVEGFLVFDYADRYEEALPRLTEWVRSGELRYRETVTEGIENAPKAFISMLTGGNIGKQVVKLVD